MRIQLAQPEARLLGPDRYNQIFTMHGANMMFLFAVPVMEAMAVYLVPLMVGTRNIAFPRLNAFSLLDLSRRRRAALDRVRARHGARRRLVRLCAAVRARNMPPASAPTSGRR